MFFSFNHLKWTLYFQFQMKVVHSQSLSQCKTPSTLGRICWQDHPTSNHEEWEYLLNLHELHLHNLKTIGIEINFYFNFYVSIYIFLLKNHVIKWYVNKEIPMLCIAILFIIVLSSEISCTIDQNILSSFSQISLRSVKVFSSHFLMHIGV